MLGISKSAVHRQKNKIEQRDRFPESYFWETEEGIGFLCRLFVGVLFLFGIKSGIGAGTISEFCKLLRIDTHVGSCPATIKNYMNKIQDMLEEYLKNQESKQVSAESLKIVGGADETFFDKMLIVFMDLASNYIFIEAEADDRTYETWKDKVQNIVNKFGKNIISKKNISIYAVNKTIRNFVLIMSNSKVEISLVFNNILDRLKEINLTNDEPMLNILSFYENNNWSVLIFPRAKHRPNQYFLSEPLNYIQSAKECCILQLHQPLFLRRRRPILRHCILEKPCPNRREVFYPFWQIFSAVLQWQFFLFLTPVLFFGANFFSY